VQCKVECKLLTQEMPTLILLLQLEFEPLGASMMIDYYGMMIDYFFYRNAALLRKAHYKKFPLGFHELIN